MAVSYPIPPEAVTPCMKASPELFFATADRLVARAKTTCGSCQFRDPCLAWALEQGMEGVWGGTDDDERAAIRKRHGIKPRRPGFSQLEHRDFTHGTESGYKSHRRRGEDPCIACKEGSRRAGADREKRRQRATA